MHVKEEGSSIWKQVLDMSGQSNAGINGQTYSINPSMGRYVRIEVAKPGDVAMDKEFRLSEIELLSNLNVASGSSVNGSSSYENSGWGKAKIVDGIPNSTTVSNGWSSWPESVSQTGNEWVEIDLGQDRDLNEVVLWPRSGGNAGVGFPVDFTIETKPSGGAYATAVARSAYPNPGAEAQSFQFPQTKVRYVRVAATKLGPSTASGKYLFQLAEIQVFNNSKLPATVQASSSYENSGWGKSKIVDGSTVSTSSSNGWTSWPPAANQQTTEWLELDLGKDLDVGSVILWPRSGGAASTGFPVDFNIQIKPEGGSYTTVLQVTNHPNPGKSAAPQVFSFSPGSARYVKISATKLGPGTASGEFLFQLAEVQVMQNQAFGSAVTSGSSVETGGWGKAKAVDGQTYSNETSMGYSSQVAEYASADRTEWVELDLGRSRSIGQVVLHPRDDGANTGEGFPVDFTIEMKTEYDDPWTTVVNRTNYANPGATPQSFTFGASTARYVRLHATKLDAVGTGYYLQLKRIEVKE